MPQFRKKPVVIDAVENIPNGDVPQWLWDACHGKFELGNTIKISTLEGIMEASPGDWIIRGVKGEIYPCKPDIFTATYDAV